MSRLDRAPAILGHPLVRHAEQSGSDWLFMHSGEQDAYHPCFSERLLQEMRRGQEALRRRLAADADPQAGIHHLLLASDANVFNLGGDLALFATLIRARNRGRLLEYARRTRRGYALPDNVGFVVNLSRRRSFSPDAAFTLAPLTEKFVDGAPIFAVEVRSVEDYGPTAERAMARKRADYFSAGTLVVWDVDTLEGEAVRVFRASDPSNPVVFTRCDTAEAEPAVPGWSMSVADLFPE